jgi:hypothetical protein
MGLAPFLIVVAWPSATLVKPFPVGIVVRDCLYQALHRASSVIVSELKFL